MSGSKINEYGIGDADLSSLMETVDNQRIGFHAVSLTEFATTNKPKIAQGSRIEVNGAIYEFDESGDEDISGMPADGTVYIKLTPSGSTITAEFTADAPTWDDEKQGWYETGTNNRYLNFAMTKSGADYSDKYRFPDHNMGIESRANGDVVFSGSIFDKNGGEIMALQYETLFEKKSWDSIDTYTFTFTYSFNPDAIAMLNVQGCNRESTIAGLQDVYIDSVTISGDQISIVVNTYLTGSVEGNVSVVCTAVKYT